MKIITKKLANSMRIILQKFEIFLELLKHF